VQAHHMMGFFRLLIELQIHMQNSTVGQLET
jgi:hypothetical protein